MGVYQKYRDKNSRPCGPWFVKYPYKRDPETGKIKYKIKKSSHFKKLAEKFLRKKEGEFFLRDEEGLAIEEPKQKKIKFSVLIEWYLEQDLVKVKGSYDTDVCRAKLLKKLFGDLIADEITQTQIRNFQAQRGKDKTFSNGTVKPATINREIALMRAVYNLGLDEGLVNKNPCAKIKFLKENNVRDRILTTNEFELLCNELSIIPKRIVKTAYHTGMRRAEIFGLTTDKIDLNKRYIELDGDDTKDYEKRRIYFGNELIEVLKECLELRAKIGVNHKYVFVRKNGNPVKCIRTGFKNACERVGLPDFHFHDIRHMYNTEMRRAGVHDSVIMKQTGHATMEMFLRYNTVDESDGREAVRMREQYLESKKSERSLCAPKSESEKISSVSY